MSFKIVIEWKKNNANGTVKDTYSTPFQGFTTFKAPVQGKWVTLEISMSSRKTIFGGTESFLPS